MRDVAHVLKKQRQIIDIELGEALIAKRSGYRAIHPEEYYAKIAHVRLMLDKSIKLLENTQDDIYENFKFLEN